MTIDPLPASGYSRVLQGQEFSTLRSPLAESNKSESSEKPVVWPPTWEDEKIDVFSVSQRYGPLVKPQSTFTNLFSGFGNQSNSSHEFCVPLVDQTPTAVHSTKLNSRNQDGKFNFLASNWSVMPSGLSLNLLNSSRKDPVHGSDVPCQARDNRYYGGVNEYSLLSGQKAEQQQGNWLRPPPLPSYLQTSHSRDLVPKPVLEHHEVAKGTCKIFGIQLASNPVAAESALSHKNTSLPGAHSNLVPHSQQSWAFETDQRSEQRDGVKVSDHTLPSSEQENPSPTSQPPIRDRQGKVQGGSTRSCTKVFIYLYAQLLLLVP